MTSGSDCAQRFLFDAADVRGETLHATSAYQDILALHEYAPGVRRLLGEFLAAAVLLSSNLKFEGKLILQARSSGEVPLLMAECNDRLEVRAIARGAEQALSDSNDKLLTEGQLVITIDPQEGQRYQGIVQLQPESLAASIDAYFAQSEQLATRIWLAADGERAAGMLLQQLPREKAANSASSAQQWEHLCTLAATTRPEELLTLDTPTLLHRLFHEDPLRLFAPQPVTFRCTCSRERSLAALASLGAPELEDMLREMPEISMDCEFCNQQYRFKRADLAPYLSAEQPQMIH